MQTTTAQWTYFTSLAALDPVTGQPETFADLITDSSTDAVEIAGSYMGRPVAEILSAGHDLEARNSWDATCPEAQRSILIGYTVERYDGQDTDEGWHINGGLTSQRPAR